MQNLHSIGTFCLSCNFVVEFESLGLKRFNSCNIFTLDVALRHVKYNLHLQVITQILTPEEFWQQHAGSAKSKAKQAGARQEVGVSGAFLSEIKPQVTSQDF